MTNYMVNNIQEIEPVVRKESAVSMKEETQGDDPPPSPVHEDPAQMKLEL